MRNKLSAARLMWAALGCLLLLSTLILGGCRKTTVVNLAGRSVIQGSGNIASEERAVSDFNRVSLTGVGKMIITQGEEESLTLETDDNLLRYVKTEVQSGTLIIGFTDEAKKKSIRPTKSIRFNLNLREMARLEVSGAGDINAASLEAYHLEIIASGGADIQIGELTAEELVVRVSGAGRFSLAGQVAEQNILISGAGHYRAAKLESRRAVVEVNGAGNATVWVTDSLDVQISGVGNVEYYGSPSVNQRISGVGRLTGLGNPQ